MLKIFVGLIYGGIHQNYYQGGDTHLYVEKGALIQSHAFTDFPLFLRLCFGPNNIKPPPDIQEHVTATYAWTDTSAYTMLRINALIAFFGKGNYALHLIFWQFFSLVGLIAIFKSFNHFYPHQYWVLLFSIFLFPSVLFWHSGIHKEALSICAIGLTTWSVVQLYLKKKKMFLYLTTTLFLIILGFIRLYTVALLLPAALVLYFTLKNQNYIWTKYITVYATLVIFAFIIGKVKPEFHFINQLIETQEYFKYQSEGTSDIDILKLESNFYSVLTKTPRALIRSALRPSLLDIREPNILMKLAAGIETLSILLLGMAAIFSRKWRWFTQQPLLVFCVMITLLYWSLIGLVIPNLGGLFRYKSVVLPLLLPVFGLMIHSNLPGFRFFRNKLSLDNSPL